MYSKTPGLAYVRTYLYIRIQAAADIIERIDRYIRVPYQKRVQQRHFIIIRIF